MPFPVTPGLSLAGRRCLVAGQGPRAERLREVVRSSGGVLAAEAGATSLDGIQVVFALEDSPEVNRDLARRARAAGALICAPDLPELSDLLYPDSLPAGEAGVTVCHPDPLIRDDLKARLGAALPARYPRLLDWFRECDRRVRGCITDSGGRDAVWRRLLAGPAAEHVLAGRMEAAERCLQAELDGAPSSCGEVYLIGAGPGDPDLLTQRAIRLLQSSQVVLHDRLVPRAVLDLVPEHCERVYVGKRRDNHPVPQREINQLLRDFALSGHRVARLKGGDPFIFGRGGEEIEELMAAGVPFQVVPGITAASGCAAYAGIPLTHRDYAQSCIFVTGHRREGGLDVDFGALVRPAQTVVCYMGLLTLEPLCRGLVEHGMDPDMPAALVEQGTTDRQRVVAATVSTLAAEVARLDVHAPTLLIIGEVVRLRDHLQWFQGSGRGGGFGQ